MRTELAATFRTALHSAFPAISVEPVVVATNQARHGDYQCNNAMQLFGRMKGKVRQTPSEMPPCQAAILQTALSCSTCAAAGGLCSQIAGSCVETDVCLMAALCTSGGCPEEAHRRGNRHCGCAARLLYDCRAAHAGRPRLHQCEAEPRLDQRADTQHAPPGKAATPWTHLRLPFGDWCPLQTDQAPLPECPLYSPSWASGADDMSGNKDFQAALRRCSMHTVVHLTALLLCRASARGHRPSNTRGR